MTTTEYDPKIGLFDLDQTLADYEGRIREFLAKMRSPNEPDPLDESLQLWDNETPDWLEARMDVIKLMPGFWSGLEKLKLGWDIFALSEKIGFENHILTKGPRSKSRAWAEKLDWVDKHIGNETPINIVAGSMRPGSKGKDKSCQYGLFLCDDYLPYVLGWLEHRHRGLVIMPAQPYNVGAEKAHPDIIRYDGSNLQQVEDAMRAVYNRSPKQHWRELLKGQS